MFKNHLLSVLVATILFLGAQAQSGEKVNNVISISANNIQAIKKGNEISGYYMFYKADKVKGGDFSYRLRILDQNANKVAEKRIIASKYFFLLEASYNQKVLAFKFYDAKSKRVSVQFYDEGAEKIKTESYAVEKMEKMMLEANIKSEIKSQPTIHPLDGLGFIEYRMVTNDKDGYTLTFHSNDKGGNKWVQGSEKNSPVLETAYPFFANSDLILNSIAKRPSRMSKKFEFSLIGLDPLNGKQLFEITQQNSKYEESMLNAFVEADKKQFHMFGYYFPKGENPIGGKSLGLVLSTFNFEGKELSKKYISWGGDVSKFLGSKGNGKFEDIGFVFFHEIFKSIDGKFYAIGESFKKTVSAGGVAVNVLSAAGGSFGGASSFQVSVDDFYFFEFNSDFELTNVEVFEKSKTRVAMPPGAGFFGANLLGLITKGLGGFDFSYLKMLNDNETFAIFYQDFEKRKKEKNKSVIGVISKTKDDYMVDKIDAETDADFVKVLPAQKGSVLFVEFFKKEKDLQLNFKKMNY